MLNKTCKWTLALSLAFTALMTSAYPAAAQTRRYNPYVLRMENDSGHPIYQVYLSASNTGNWGRDRLGTQVFHDGDTLTIDGISPNIYDLKFVFQTGVACEVYDVAIFDNEDVDLTAESLLSGCDEWR